MGNYLSRNIIEGDDYFKYYLNKRENSDVLYRFEMYLLELHIIAHTFIL